MRAVRTSLFATLLVVAACAEPLSESPDFIEEKKTSARDDDFEATEGETETTATEPAGDGDAALGDRGPSSPGVTPADEAKAEAEAPPPDEPAAPGSLRVATLNIVHGETVKLDLAKLAKEINEMKPDVVGLQEVDDGTARSGGKSQTKELAALTGLTHSYFGAAFAFDGGSYGLAILSRYPLANTRVIRLDTRTARVAGKEPRIAVAADVMSGTGIPFATLHAAPYADERAPNARALIAGLGAAAPRAVVCGDLNDVPGSEITRLLAGAGLIDTYAERHPTSRGFTTPASAPARRINYVYRGKTMRTTEHGWVDTAQVSTHRAVGAVIAVR